MLIWMLHVNIYIPNVYSFLYLCNWNILYKFYDMHFIFFTLFGIRSVKRASQHKLERSGKYFGKQYHLVVVGIPQNRMSVIYGGLSDLWIKCSSSYNSGPTIEGIPVLQGSEDGM